MNDYRFKTFTEDQCNDLYELYSYMVDASTGIVRRPSRRILEKLGTDAGRVVLAVLKSVSKPHKTGKVIPLKRRTV